MEYSGFSELCVCGRTFHEQGALSYHKRTCKKSKSRLAGALDKAKQTWKRQKRRRLDDVLGASSQEPAQTEPTTEIVDTANPSIEVR